MYKSLASLALACTFVFGTAVADMHGGEMEPGADMMMEHEDINHHGGGMVHDDEGMAPEEASDMMDDASDNMEDESHESDSEVEDESEAYDDSEENQDY